jgi:hypothetical protein
VFGSAAGRTFDEAVALTTRARDSGGLAAPKGSNLGSGLLSPELALVDPVLRTAALAALPSPSDCLAARDSALAGESVNRSSSSKGGASEGARAQTASHPITPARPNVAVADIGSETSAARKVRTLAVLLAVFLSAYFVIPALLDLLGVVVGSVPG